MVSSDILISIEAWGRKAARLCDVRHGRQHPEGPDQWHAVFHVATVLRGGLRSEGRSAHVPPISVMTKIGRYRIGRLELGSLIFTVPRRPRSARAESPLLLSRD